MRKLITIAALMLSACTTTKSYVIEEPGRSEYYFFCIQNGVPVTTCQCMEARAVEKTGITTLEDADEATAEKFIGALQAEVLSCNEETIKLLKKDVEE